MLAPDDSVGRVGLFAVIEVEPSAYLIVALLAAGGEGLIDVCIFSDKRREVCLIFWPYAAEETVDVKSRI